MDVDVVNVVVFRFLYGCNKKFRVIMGLGVNLGPEQLRSCVYKCVCIKKGKITNETTFLFCIG